MHVCAPVCMCECMHVCVHVHKHEVQIRHLPLWLIHRGRVSHVNPEFTDMSGLASQVAPETCFCLLCVLGLQGGVSHGSERYCISSLWGGNPGCSLHPGFEVCRTFGTAGHCADRGDLKLHRAQHLTIVSLTQNTRGTSEPCSGEQACFLSFTQEGP